MIKNIANNRLFKSISTIVEIIITVVLIVLILLTGIQKFSNRGSFFGFRIFTVATGSMIPMYNIGDTLLIKDVPMDDIKIGDAVTYKAEVGKMGMVNITHEVIDVEIDEKGKYSYHTKGIANNVEDPIVGEDQVVGKVVYRFFLLSILGYITTSKVLLLLVITIPMAILVSIEIIKMLYDEERKVAKEKKLTKGEVKELEKDSHILTEEERQRKIEAIRNGTNTVEVNKKNNIEEHRILSPEEMQKKIDKIKSSHVHSKDAEEKLISDIIKADHTEEINFDAISDIEDREEKIEQEDKKDNSIKIDEEEIIETMENIKKEHKETSDEEIDEFLKYLREKLIEEKKEHDKDVEE